MSTTPPAGPPAKESTGNRFSRQIDEAFERASKLAGSSLPPTEFYEQFLNETLKAIDAPAGAVWLRTPQGFLQVACQKELDKVGLDQKRGGRQCHNEILRQVFQANPSRPVMIPPQEQVTGLAEPGPVPARNLTEYFALFAPIVDQQKAAFGLLEVFQAGDHDPRLYPTFLNYAVQMAGYASQYHQFTAARANAGLDKVFTQIESFARLIHGTLNPTECAYHVANEGRRLIECDRLSVGVRHGKKVTVEAVSGADVVEKAATHVRRMRALFNAVLKWGDKLVFKGEKDDSLPPDVLHALDDYLADQQPKLLVVLPIRDEREKDEKKRARSVLLLESFNPPENVEPLVQKLEIVGKHAASALYNAAEWKSVPFRPLWWPVKKIQDGLGGKARLFTGLGVVAVAGLVAAMVLVPAPLKLDAKGQLEPVEIGQVFAKSAGQVRMIHFKSGDKVNPDAEVATLFSDELNKKYRDLSTDIAVRNAQLASIRGFDLNKLPETERFRNMQLQAEAQAYVNNNSPLLRQLVQDYNMDPTNPGKFAALAPRLDPSKVPPGAKWTLLNADIKDQLLNRMVRENEPIQRLGFVEGDWHVTLKIPQRNIGHIYQAFADDRYYKVEQKAGQPDRKYLDVDLLLTSESDKKYFGRLYQDKITAEAVPNKDDHNESEPVVVAYVKINLDDFPADKRIPREMFVTGLESHMKIKCGDRPLGYSLFHGVWEWFYEKVIFYF